MLTPNDFERMYGADDDPFQIASSWYERRKIAIVLASLAEAHYRRVWDTACGTGHLTAELARRSGYLVATDAAPRACELTRHRLVGIGTTDTSVHTLPDVIPDSAEWPFDLVVLSEVLYYLSPADRQQVPLMLTNSTDPEGAEVLAVNWRHHPEDAYISGAEAIRQLDRELPSLGWRPVVRHADEDFVLNTWRRLGGATREGDTGPRRARIAP